MSNLPLLPALSCKICSPPLPSNPSIFGEKRKKGETRGREQWLGSHIRKGGAKLEGPPPPPPLPIQAPQKILTRQKTDRGKREEEGGEAFAGGHLNCPELREEEGELGRGNSRGCSYILDSEKSGENAA